MKILQVNTSDSGGGAEKSAYALFSNYRESGHKSWLAVGNKYLTDDDIFEIPNLRSYNHNSQNFNRNSLKSISFLINLVFSKGKRKFFYLLGRELFDFPGTRHLLELPPEKPDILHLHNLHGNYFDLRYLPQLSKEIPTIINLRDMWLLTGHCAYSKGCERWKNGCGNCPDLSIYPSIRVDSTRKNFKTKNDIFKKSKLYLTTPSVWLKEQISHSFLSIFPIKVIPNGIDLSIFKPGSRIAARKKLNLPEDAKIILSILHNEFKNKDLIFETINKIAVEHNIDYVHINLQREKQPNVISNNIKTVFPAFVKDPNIMALYYQASDLFIHSASGEIFGRTIAEAMACELPVVGMDNQAVSELIEDSVTGFLVPYGDTDLMAQRISEILKNINISSNFGGNALQVANNKFDLNIQSASFIEWYKEILNN